MKQIIILLFLALSLFGCADTKDEEEEETVPQPTYIQVNNQSNADITQVYIRQSSAADWGEDLLPDLQVISNGQTQNFKIVTCDIPYDVQVWTLLGISGVEFSNLNIACEQTKTITLTAE